VQGNLQQRGPSSWRIRVFLGRDDTGKKRYLERTVRGTKREAQRVMARLVVEVDEGRHVAAAATTFGAVLDRWLEVKSATVEATTLASYRWIATTYLVPRMANTPLDNIRALDLDTMYARLRAAGGTDGGPLSARTVRYCHTVVSQVLGQARCRGLVARNVAAEATVPRSKRSEVSPPTVDVLRALLQAAVEWDPEFALYLRVLAATGCRRAEALALRWSDIEFATGELNLRRSIALVGGKPVEKDTKGHQSRRIAIDPATVSALEMHRTGLVDCGLAAGPEAFVFSPDDGRARPWRPDNISYRFIRLCVVALAWSVSLCTTSGTSWPRTSARLARRSRPSARGSGTGIPRPH
jgi:integrase